MHVISKKTLKDFSEWHPEARNPLEAWFSIMEKTSFHSFQSTEGFHQVNPDP